MARVVIMMAIVVETLEEGFILLKAGREPILHTMEAPQDGFECHQLIIPSSGLVEV